MLVEQAIFTSVRSRRAQGYHVVAASAGVDERVLQALTTWGPSHASLLSREPDAESWNFHPLPDDWYGISRTTHGGSEYSGRGGLQVFTHFLLLRADQLERYDFDSLQFARTAHALGYLRLKAKVPELLNALDLPDHPLTIPTYSSDAPPLGFDEILRTLRFQNRLVVLGQADPLPLLMLLLRETKPADRLHLSFCTGLRPSVHRSFQLHFATEADAALYSQIAQQGLDFVTTA